MSPPMIIVIQETTGGDCFTLAPGRPLPPRKVVIPLPYLQGTLIPFLLTEDCKLPGISLLRFFWRIRDGEMAQMAFKYYILFLIMCSNFFCFGIRNVKVEFHEAVKIFLRFDGHQRRFIWNLIQLASIWCCTSHLEIHSWWLWKDTFSVFQYTLFLMA